LAKERRARAVRALIWLVGAAVGAGALLTLTLQTWGSQFPVWVGIVVVAATMLCGDMAERAWQRLSGGSAVA
jgi:Na+(H+)/acetate symporter ActP